MSAEIREGSKAAEKLDLYRQVKPDDCFYAETDLGPLILIFDCPEVKNLGPEERYGFLPTTAVPVPLTSPLLLIDIDVYGKHPIRVAFSWKTGVPERMLTAKYLVLFAARKSKGIWGWLKKNQNMREFGRRGALDVDLTNVRQNLESVILPLKELLAMAEETERMVNNGGKPERT